MDEETKKQVREVLVEVLRFGATPHRPMVQGTKEKIDESMDKIEGILNREKELQSKHVE